MGFSLWDTHDVSNTSIGHDLKSPRRRKRPGFAFTKDFFIGLSAGLAVAVVVYLGQQEAISAMEADLLEMTAKKRADRSATESETPDAAPPIFDFPRVLPTREVVIVEHAENVERSSRPSAPILRPGDHVLHLGLFDDPSQANALKAKLLRLGLLSEIQSITVDGADQLRVRIGVIRDLEELNRIRSVLQRSGIEFHTVRVGE